MRIVLSEIAAFRLVETDAAVLLHRQIGDPAAFLLEMLAGIDHGLVLGDCRDDVVALLAIHAGDALDRQVVRFGRAAREDDFLRVGADQIGDLLAGFFDRFLRLPPERMVAAGGIAEVLGEVGHHRLEHARIDRRGRVIVHVDRKLDCHSCRRIASRHWKSRRPHKIRVEHRGSNRCLRRRFRRKLRDGAFVERRQNPFTHAPQRIAYVALRKLLALALVCRAGRHRHRAVDRLDHIGDRNLGRPAGQLVSAVRALVRGEEPAADEPLKHLRHQFDRDTVQLGNFTGARGPHQTAIAAEGQMFHRDQGVIGLFGEPQHCRFRISDRRVRY